MSSLPFPPAGTNVPQGAAPDGLAAITRAVAELAPDDERTVDEAVRMISELLGDLAVLALTEAGDAGRLSTIALHHPDPAAAGLARSIAEQEPRVEAWPLIAAAFERGEALHLPEVTREMLREGASPALEPYLDEFGIHTGIIVPLARNGRPLGVLILARGGGRPAYTIADLRRAEELAAQLALTVDNARLFSSLRAEHEFAERLLAAQSELGIGVGLLDLASRRIVFANPALAEMFGFELEELLALPTFLDLMREEDRPVLDRRVDARLAGEPISRHLELQASHRDGRLIDLEVAARAVTGPGGPQVLAVVRDVTDRRAAEHEVELRAQLLDEVGAAVIATDADAVITHWSRGAQELFGWTAEEAVGRRGRDFLIPEQTRGQSARALEALRAGAVAEGEFLFRRKDGTNFPALSRSVPFRDERGEIAGYVGVSVDVSERRREREELADSRERFRALYRSMPLPCDIWRREGDDFVLIDVNDAGKRLGGPKAAAMIGTPARAYYADVPEILAELEHCFRTGETITRERDHVLRSNAERKRLRMTFARVPPDMVVIQTEDVTGRQRDEQRLRMQASLLDEVDAAVIAVDADGRIAFWNRQAERMFGWSADEVIGADPLEITAAMPLEQPEQLMREVRSGRREWEAEFRVRRRDGSTFPVYARTTTLRGPDGEPAGFVGVAVDVTERHRATERLREAERNYRSLVERLPAITYVAPGERGAPWYYVSPQIEGMLGYTPEEWLAAPGLWEQCLHPDDRERALAVGARSIEEREPIDSEYRLLARDGSAVWVRDEALIREEAGEIVIEGLLTDVTDRKRFESQLQQLADHDPLTGLFNRRRFVEELGREWRQVERGGEPAAVVVLDLDNFKYVNDSLGHQAGDDLIRSVAAILRDRLRTTDVLARLGGDEFALILHATANEQAAQVARELLDAIRAGAHAIGPEPVRVTASAGVAELRAHESTAEEALAEADLAMYEAKRGGRDRVCPFTPELRERSTSGQSWAERIRSALEQELFDLHAQPIVSVADGALRGYELLVRMRGDEGELIAPAAFLPVAERFDLVQAIDRWVVSRAIRLSGELAERGRPVVLSVNVSGRTFGDPAYVRHVEQELARHPVERGQLVFEVTETAAIANMDQARAFSERLAGLGCRLALDDFGSGFGSFYYLKHLPVDLLKIDGDFVRSLTAGRIDQEVVRAIVQVAASAGQRTVAEFVGDDATLDLLRRFGVDYAQGYHVGRPRPLAELLED